MKFKDPIWTVMFIMLILLILTVGITVFLVSLIEEDIEAFKKGGGIKHELNEIWNGTNAVVVKTNYITVTNKVKE